MDERERQNIISVLDKAIEVLKKKDLNTLKQLSNQSVHDAAVYQDEYAITLAVMIYSLSKIHERESHLSQFKGWKKYCDDCHTGLIAAKEALVLGDIDKFINALKSYVTNLTKLDFKLKLHIQDVLRKAKINKASRLYEHGLSLGRTAELLGINRFELMDYVGKTYIADVEESITMSAKKRLEFSRRLFS